MLNWNFLVMYTVQCCTQHNTVLCTVSHNVQRAVHSTVHITCPEYFSHCSEMVCTIIL